MPDPPDAQATSLPGDDSPRSDAFVPEASGSHCAETATAHNVTKTGNKDFSIPYAPWNTDCYIRTEAEKPNRLQLE
ncbi:hypothetical protein F183_A20640 [Bryobacterales bacterium F-183]|nr:hypothetical protein F183_A20640 [Bryobacterales bacterium F-183]